MTDKQIIDGVDVSGCENYIGANTKTHNCTLYDGYLRPCKNADCYYKQLKRKEQECEQLKITIEENSYRYAELDADFEQSKKECEELKKQLESTKGLVTVGNRLLEQALKENEELTTKCSLLKLENIKQGNKILALKSKRLNMFEHLDIVQKNIEYEEFLKDLKVTTERARKHLFATKSEDYSDGMKWLGCLLWNRIEELEEKLQKTNEAQNDKN